MKLRVMAYNLYFGGADRLAEIDAVLAHAAADLITLTEADDPQVVAELARRQNFFSAWERGSGDRHIALLSRYPIRQTQIYNQRPITQAALVNTIELPAPAPCVTLYSVHLLPYLLWPFELRRAQALQALLKIIRAAPPGPHLILGDLNAIAPHDRVLQHLNPPRMQRVMLWQARLIFRWALPVLLRAGYVDCFRACHPADAGFTWHTGRRTTRYDYIFADAWFAARLHTCGVLDDHPAAETASDHYPLIAEFELDD